MKLAMLVTSLLGFAVAALNTTRDQTEEINKIKADANKEIENLKRQLAESQANDEDYAELENLRAALEDAVNRSAAARPPLPEQVQQVVDSTHAMQPEAPPVSGGLDPVENGLRENQSDPQAEKQAEGGENQPPNP